jgi:hypothetical protein
VQDPTGVAWEHFHTLEGIPVFREPAPAESTAAACCAPAPRGTPVAIPVVAKSGCC